MFKFYILSGSDDQTIKKWNPNTEECISTFTGHTDSVYGLEVMPVHGIAHEIVISCSWDSTIKIWTDKGECLKTLVIDYEKDEIKIALKKNP
jgi:WD40 repeat protein